MSDVVTPQPSDPGDPDALGTDPAASLPVAEDGLQHPRREYTASELHLLHEVTTMALYLSLSLLAVLIALPNANPEEDNRFQEGLTVLVTGLGLLLAHHVAYRMSSRLVNQGLLTDASRHAMKAQALGGLPVAALASLPVFLLGEDPGEDVAIFLLLALVLGVGYRSARFNVRPIRALAYTALLVLVVLGVVVVKLLTHH